MAKDKTSDRSLVNVDKRTPEYHAEAIARRAKVAEYMKRRIPQVKIAELLKVDQSTISRDVKAITKKVAKQLDGKVDSLRARESQTLDHLEMDAQANYENAIKARQGEEKPPGKGKQAVKSVAWERYDRAARSWFEKRLQVTERRAKLLNLDQKEVQDTKVKVDMPITFIMDNREQKPPRLANDPPVAEIVEGKVRDGSS